MTSNLLIWFAKYIKPYLNIFYVGYIKYNVGRQKSMLSKQGKSLMAYQIAISICNINKAKFLYKLQQQKPFETYKRLNAIYIQY